MSNIIIGTRFASAAGTATTTTATIVAAADRRCRFVVSLDAADGVLELFLGEAATANGTGILVRGGAPFVWDQHYYGPIHARATTGTVAWRVTEVFR